ncbi:hypothetical protein EVAR_98293_1 [Eumeta japonica]|uniref:Uncharacterized protein n=1 Tax=Eumeta variegata TaxID=151549 RepID=A0A4C1XDQ3_EUMVA|nr:hypothetical protein EVAR_98293_1 [Eumeta japonica]
MRDDTEASATSATADGLAPEGASQTKKFCLQVIKKRPRKPDVADVHEWCSAATAHERRHALRVKCPSIISDTKAKNVDGF